MKPSLHPLVVGLSLLSSLHFVGSAQAADAPPPPPPPPPTNTVAVLATDPTALVGSSTAAFTFIRSGETNADLAVPFAYSGTAVLGTDFTDATSTSTPPAPRFVTIPAGMFAVDLVIQPKLDPANRGNKTVIVTLDTVALGAGVAVETSHRKATVRLIDDTFNDTPPTVTLTTPAPNSSFTLPATVVLTAQADAEDTVQKVSFYAEDTFLGSATSSPFTFSWVNPRIGQYDLFARAIDSTGRSTLSQPVHITVTGAAPTISITAPADKSTVEPHSSVPVQVQATGIGNLTVRIADGSRLLAELKQPPYQVTWTNVLAGKHTLYARVTDSVGQTALTSIQVSAVDLPPVVQITSPATGANSTAGTDLTITAKATDPDDTIKSVTFSANHHLLGTGTVSTTDPTSFSFTWKSPEAGLYSLQAVATNSNGTKTTSTAVIVSVSKN